MTVLIQLGSCGASWPENTTPIQRLKAITPFFDHIVLVDTAPAPNLQLRHDKYVRVAHFTMYRVFKILRHYHDERIMIWFGPSARLAMIVLTLRLFTRFQFVVDLYDHEHLSSGIARANGAWFKALKYRLFEGFIKAAALRADLLVSAISEDRYAHEVNRVKALNGVAVGSLAEMDCDQGPGALYSKAHLTICFVGVVNGERAGLLRAFAAGEYGYRVDLLLIGENDPVFLCELRQCAAPRGEVSVVAPGFRPWAEAMCLVAASDICLYVFPPRPELDCVYPIKMGEYMELQKPVIATPSKAIREVFKDCPGVLQCDIDRPGDWVSAARDLADDSETRQQLGASNRAFVRGQLDWSITQKELLSRLHALLATDIGKLQQ